ncbi:MAG: 4Fe-4S binding protein [Spirochaetota bacterium]
MIPIIDKDTCSGCTNCVEICPPQAISMINGTAFIEVELCEECGFCAAECPVDAISIHFPLSGNDIIPSGKK